MTFLRYQEFYEAADDRFREKKFTIAQFMAAYSKDNSGPRTRYFSYPTDWSGFNIPADIIRQVRELGIDDPNHYDSLMHGVYEMIQADTEGPAYLIGTYGRAKKSLDHELAHAMFYIDGAYQDRVLNVINGVSDSLRENLYKALRHEGYTDKTIPDEIQAYITTGELKIFEKVEEKDELDELRQTLKKLHEEYNKHFK